MTGVLIDLSSPMGQIAMLIEAGFHDMPGMRLTEAQASRLWGRAPGDCRDALEYLCEAGQLARDPSGRYLLPPTALRKP